MKFSQIKFSIVSPFSSVKNFVLWLSQKWSRQVDVSHANYFISGAGKGNSLF